MVDTQTALKESAYKAFAKAQQAVGQLPTVGTHDQADKSVTFHGYASLAQGTAVEVSTHWIQGEALQWNTQRNRTV